MRRSFALIILLAAVVFSAIASLDRTAADGAHSERSDDLSDVRHIVWVWFENREATAITATTVPYFTSFAAANVNFTNFYGVTHPSQPNYLDAWSGSNQGVTNDSYCTFPSSVDSLAKQMATAGKSWRVYAQNFPGNCSDAASFTGGVDGPGLAGQYVRKHNPAIGFESVRFNATECSYIQPLANFDPTVNIAFVVPNMTNDMHDGTTAQGDAFLQAFVPLVTSSPDWQHTLLIVTFDEGTTTANGGGHVYTAAAAPWLAHSNVATTYNQYSVLRTIEYINGLPYLGNAGAATTITELLPPEATPTPSPCQATLYGADNGGRLFTLNTTTGAGTLVGMLPVAQPTEIAYDPSSGRAIVQDGGFTFIGHEFNILTGGGIGGDIDEGANFTGFEWVGPVLYAASMNTVNGPSSLRTLNPWTGTSTIIGTTGVGPIAGLAYDVNTGTMYGVTAGQGPFNLVTINLTTGAATVVGPLGIVAGALKFGPDGLLYAGGARGNTNRLYRVSPATGAATIIGLDGFNSDITGLATICVGASTPTPSPAATPTPTRTPTPTPTPAGATHFAVSAPSFVIQYFSFNVTVTALDQFNNVVTSYPGTVHFTSTDINPNGTHLPPDSTLTNGTGTFIARLGTPGTQTITATDTANDNITGTSGPIFVQAKGMPTPTQTPTPTPTPTPIPTPTLTPLPTPSPTCNTTYLYQEYSNPEPIAPADRASNDPGTPPGLPANYPSVIQATILEGDTFEVPATCIVSRVTVSFAITSERPDDLDILLVGPTGARSSVISDAGGSGQIAHADFLFGAGGPAFPDETPPATGYYMPANYPGLAGPEPGGMDNFPGVSGLANYPVVDFYNLSGAGGHGTWQLYVVDDETGNLSSLPDGWHLTLLTECHFGPCVPTPTQSPPIPTPTPTPSPTPSPFPEYDLTISQADSPDPVVSGHPLTYRLIVSNIPSPLGGTACPDVRFNFPSGPPFVFTSATGAGGFVAMPDAKGVTFSGGCLSSMGGQPPATVTLTVVITSGSAGILTSAGSDVVVDPANLWNETNEGNNAAVTVNTTVVNAAANFDFDGDHKADLSVFRPSVGEWYYQRSSNGVTSGFQFGTATDRPVPADLTGDGKTDIAFWRPSTGEWFVLRSENSTYFAFPFGTNGDVPVPADYDGDGTADAAVFRPSIGTWFILRSTGGVSSVQFGISSDQPVPSDYDGDGKADIAIWRAGPGEWWVLKSSNSQVFAVQFGTNTDKPVAGDYTGDGKSDVAFWRPSNGVWYILRSEDLSYYAFNFGQQGDKPVPADYDGDGKFDPAVFRPSDTNWYILRSTGGVYIQQYGAPGDIPLPGAFVP